MEKNEVKQVESTIALLDSKATEILRTARKSDHRRHMYDSYILAALALTKVLVELERRPK